MLATPLMAATPLVRQLALASGSDHLRPRDGTEKPPNLDLTLEFEFLL
jgi:hypothetical protein